MRTSNARSLIQPYSLPIYSVLISPMLAIRLFKKICMQGIHENSKSSQKVFSLLPITSKLQGIKTQPTMSRVEAAQPLPQIIKHPNFASKTTLNGMTMPRALSRQIESPNRRFMSFQRTIMYQKKKASLELMRMKKTVIINTMVTRLNSTRACIQSSPCQILSPWPRHPPR